MVWFGVVYCCETTDNPVCSCVVTNQMESTHLQKIKQCKGYLPSATVAMIYYETHRPSRHPRKECAITVTTKDSINDDRHTSHHIEIAPGPGMSSLLLTCWASMCTSYTGMMAGGFQVIHALRLLVTCCGTSILGCGRSRLMLCK